MMRLRLPRARRGTNAIEFALTIPVFIAMVIGIFEFGWFFWQKSTTIDAVRHGCREGSLYSADADADGAQQAVDIAYAEIVDRLATTNLCGGTCLLSAYTARRGSTDFLFCSAEVEYQSITGFFPTSVLPDYSRAESFVRLEVQ